MEKNREILKKALDRMKVYDPPEEVWNAIVKIMQEEDRAPGFRKLTAYSPPDSVWENIDRRLALTDRGKGEKWSITILKWTAAVAAIVIPFVIIFSVTGNREIRTHYSEEWVVMYDIRNNTSNDSLFYDAIDNKCRKKPEICQSDEFLGLKKELDFLDHSKKTIMNRLNKYESGKDLEALLIRIDLEREEILGKLIAISN
ncbi:MAG: hypothetical protein KBC43_10935 [Bacteroidales bacterium]|jgi:hypothetical protein|nr:hypothetical protein [Bacteroidales bacterium]MDX9905130.1 hypothetical protein [Bacteroidales bacterium]